jgi:hypothetical protein
LRYAPRRLEGSLVAGDRPGCRELNTWNGFDLVNYGEKFLY